MFVVKFESNSDFGTTQVASRVKNDIICLTMMLFPKLQTTLLYRTERALLGAAGTASSGRYRRKKTWKIQDFSFFVVNLSLDHKPFLLIFHFWTWWFTEFQNIFKIFSKYFSCSKLILHSPEFFFLTKNILPTFVFGICWFYKLSKCFQNLLFVF